MFFYGIPLLSNLAIFTSGFRSIEKVTLGGDVTPPPPPTLAVFPSYTNKTSLDITGKTEEGAIVTIYLDSSQKEVLANKDGKFTFVLTLKDGENSFYVKAKDSSGNVSQESQKYVVIFDNKVPLLTITNPSNTSFYGQAQRQVQIQGETESGVDLTVNDRLVVVDPNGKFTFNTSLVEGENQFVIKAFDEAGNESETEITLTFNQ